MENPEKLPKSLTDPSINQAEDDKKLVKRGRPSKPKVEQVIEETETILAEKPKPKVKKVVNDNTLNALAEGRKKLAEKWDTQRQEREAYAEKIAIKKANQVIRAKMNIKKSMGAEDLSSDEEELIKTVQPRKPKKKQVVYLPPESDSEEEVIYKKPPKQEKKVIQQQPLANNNSGTRIIFC